MLKLAGIGFLLMALFDPRGGSWAGLAQTLVGAGFGAGLLEAVRLVVCARWCRNPRVLTKSLALLVFLPSIASLLFYVENIYGYCLGFGMIIGFIVALVLVLGDLCSDASDAIIKKHNEIGAIGG